MMIIIILHPATCSCVLKNRFRPPSFASPKVSTFIILKRHTSIIAYYFNQIDFKKNISEAESIQIDEKKKKKYEDDEEEFEEDSEMFDTVSDLNDYLKKINSNSF